MEFRYLASALIVVISVYIAYQIQRYGANKIGFYHALVEFVSYIKNQILYFRTPTDKIISEFNSSVLERYGFLSLVEKGDWRSAAETNGFLDPDTKELMYKFGSKLGKSTAEDQIANCDYTLDVLNKYLSEYKTEIPKKYKAYSSLAVIFGFMILILLI